VTRTVTDGRLSFNQVVKTSDDPEPAAVLLVGWDQDAGVYLWLKSQADVLQHSSPQHGDYSRGIARFKLESPPDWLGTPTFLDKDLFDGWEDIGALQTNTKRAAILAKVAELITLP
jgi:hypothetical protein